MTRGETSSSRLYLLRELMHSALHLAVLLGAAGRWDWPNAWAAIGLGMSFQVINYLVLARYNPGLIVARAKLIQPETKAFDKTFVALFMALGLAISVTAGLDARWGWSAGGAAMVTVGAVLYVGSCVFGLWAMTVNRHFETTVVVRTDGSQRVCEAGPYRWVRHPGYLAAVVGSFGYALLLGSWPATALNTLLAAVFVWRTAREDETLRRELPGYAEYVRRTGRRLFPGF